MKNVLLGICAVAVLAILVYMEVQVWDECREKNSFWYCMRVMHK